MLHMMLWMTAPYTPSMRHTPCVEHFHALHSVHVHLKDGASDESLLQLCV